MSSAPPNLAGSIPAATAAARVSIGPVPAWVDACEPALDFVSPEENHTTLLLRVRQVHAELQQTYYHSALRLETMQAVQNESQWRLQFEPGTQSVILHSIRLRRGDQIIEQADLSKLRMLQREEGLDGYVISGWTTLLLLLEDVRPKDVLEASFTIHEVSRILPGNCEDFFSLPETVSVGRYRFRTCSAENRPLRWKSSTDTLRPVESLTDGVRIWSWEGTNHTGRKLEPEVPAWHISYPWIQVSDCPDWGHIAQAIHAAWAPQLGQSDIAGILKEIVGEESDLLAKVEKVLRFVQDELRYLSVNLEFGGQIPTPPATVARQRFGDCKDLSFLLVQLLRTAGVPARPILVHTQLRRAIFDLLPTPSLFNHVVVEFHAEGKTCWVDSTVGPQGGGPLRRWIPPFGCGLPVDSSAQELSVAPSPAPDNYKIEIRETLLMDTTGEDLVLGTVETHHGYYADRLRAWMTGPDREKMEEGRRASQAQRFKHAVREGSVQYRDDRDAGMFVLAETFRVNRCFYPHPHPGMCRFAIPDPWAGRVLPGLTMKEGDVRRAPLALPQPLVISHSLDIEFTSLPPLPGPRDDVTNAFFRYSQRIRGLHGSWCISSSFSTLVDSIPAAKVNEYHKQLKEMWAAAGWYMDLRRGVPRRPTRGDFNKLPELPPKRPTATMPPTQVAQHAPSLKGEPGTALSAERRKSHPEKSKIRRSRLPKNRLALTIFIIFAVLWGGFFLFVFITQYRSRP